MGALDTLRDGPSWGIQLPVQAQSTIFAEEWEATAGADELAAAATAAESAGAAYVAVCDHTAIPAPYDEPMGSTWYHTVATLGFVAGITQRVGLMSHVVVPVHTHPLHTAKAFCTLDRLSGGRAVLGVGAGHLQPEFELLGTPFQQRGALLDEAIAVIAAAFADEYPKAEGPTWPLDGTAAVAPRPVQDRIPILVGGSSPAAIRRAGRVGGWLPQGTPRDHLPAAIETLRSECAEAGGDPERLVIGANVLGLYIGGGWEPSRPSILGPPDQIATEVRAWLDAGANLLQIHPRSRSGSDYVDQIERFGAEVWPLVQS